MLKNNKKACKQLYKYYNKEFKDCEKNFLSSPPNYLICLDGLMLYLQYMQDTIAITESLATSNDEVNNKFLTLGIALESCAKYQQCILDGSKILKNKELSEEEHKKQAKEILTKASINWVTLWQTIALTMEGWSAHECFMK